MAYQEKKPSDSKVLPSEEQKDQETQQSIDAQGSRDNRVNNRKAKEPKEPRSLYQIKGTVPPASENQSQQVSQYKIKGTTEPNGELKPEKVSQYKVKGTIEEDSEIVPTKPKVRKQNRDNQYVSKDQTDEYSNQRQDKRQDRRQDQTYQQDRRAQEKNDKKPQRRADVAPKREEKYSYDRTLVTLLTVVPEFPKKNEIINKPKRDDLDDKLDVLDRQIDDVHDQLHDYSDQVMRAAQDLKYEKHDSTTKELLKAKIAQKRAVRVEFNTINDEFKIKKKDLSDLQEQADVLRGKMKNFERAEDITSELRRLKDRQRNDKINANEEKTICKQISELERSLPYAVPLEAIEKKLEMTRQEKGKIGKILNEIYTLMHSLDDEIKGYQSTLDEQYKHKDQTQKTLDPKIQARKQEFRDQIDALKDKKREVVKQYHDTYDKYEDQEEFIHHVEWLQRQKDRLLKIESQRKYEEDRLKREEARNKRLASQSAKDKELDESEGTKKSNPFQPLIELCEQLIVYCQKLQPQQTTTKGKLTEEKKNVDAILKGDDWKKDKVTVIKGKGERTEDEFASLAQQKTNKVVQQKAPQVDQQKPLSKLLEHAFQTINLFDQIKVPVPFVPADLEKTLQLIEERRVYYSNAPSEEKKTDQEDGGNPTQKKDSNKRGNKRNYERVEISEQEFPTF